MDIISFFLLFPSIFMLHEFEEILLFPRFWEKNRQQQRIFPFGHLTPFRLNLVIFEEFAVLLIILGASLYYESFTVYLTVIIAYIYHVLGHILQGILLRSYVPGIFSGIVTGGYCAVRIYDAVSGNYWLLAYSFITLAVIFINIGICFKVLSSK